MNSFLYRFWYLPSVFFYFGYHVDCWNTIPGCCLLLAFRSWMAKNIYLLSYTVVIPPLPLDQGRMSGYFPFWGVRTWSYWSSQKKCWLACNYLCLLGGCFSLGQAGQKAVDLDMKHSLAVCVGEGGAEWNWVDGIVFMWSPCFLSHCIWPDISSWHNITVGVASVFF